MNYNEINKFRDYVGVIDEGAPPEDFIKQVKERAGSIMDICDLLTNIADTNTDQYRKALDLMYSLIDGIVENKSRFVGNVSETLYNK